MRLLLEVSNLNKVFKILSFEINRLNKAVYLIKKFIFEHIKNLIPNKYLLDLFFTYHFY